MFWKKTKQVILPWLLSISPNSFATICTSLCLALNSSGFFWLWENSNSNLLQQKSNEVGVGGPWVFICSHYLALESENCVELHPGVLSFLPGSQPASPAEFSTSYLGFWEPLAWNCIAVPHAGHSSSSYCLALFLTREVS